MNDFRVGGFIKELVDVDSKKLTNPKSKPVESKIKPKVKGKK